MVYIITFFTKISIFYLKRRLYKYINTVVLGKMGKNKKHKMKLRSDPPDPPPQPPPEEPVDEEAVDEEPVDEEGVDEEPVDEEGVDEEGVDEEGVDEEGVDEEGVDEEEPESEELEYDEENDVYYYPSETKKEYEEESEEEESEQEEEEDEPIEIYNKGKPGKPTGNVVLVIGGSSSAKMMKKRKKECCSNEDDTIEDGFSPEEQSYWDKLDKPEQEKYITEFKKVKNSNILGIIPLKFKILNNLDMDFGTKNILLAKIDQFNNMSENSGEYFKLRNWLNAAARIPFNKTNPLPIKPSDPVEKCSEFLTGIRKKLDDTVYGHGEAKDQILRILAQWISNPSSQGHCIGIQGNMGTGKCLAYDTEIIMYNGSIKKVQDIEIGDLLMGDDSTPRKVLGLGRGKDKMYEISNIKGDKYTVNSEHILSLTYSNTIVDICIKDYLKLPVNEQSNFKEYKVKFENKKIYKDTDISQITVKELPEDNYYGFELDGNGRFILGNFIVTHNTSLVKEGICKALNLPFGFIALGGASDGSFLDGHSFTYEGSTYGKIAEVLMKTQCMNPVIFFDELDKVSTTHRGDEIIGILTHLTDSSQNEKFNDRYFGEIDLDLSKALIIFSYNDESRINPILKDRLITIHVKGYNSEDKLKIAHDYLLPQLLKQYNISKEDIIFTDEVINTIIQRVKSEEGVRNLKRGLEALISWINMLRYTEKDKIKFPFTIKDEDVKKYLKAQESNISLNMMYL